MRLPLLLILSLLLSSCVTHEQLVNFNTGPEFPAGAEPTPAVPEPLIQPFDGLALSVQAVDPEVAAPFNLGTGVSAATPTGSGPTLPGTNYQVDALGNIDLPFLGAFHIAGLTVAQARDSIQARLLPFLKEPFVTLRRFAQFRFTVLGEVKNSTSFTVTEDRLTILQALGMAGDLTNYGNRENILVVREQNGQRTYGRLNLRDRSVFRSPYFYLQQNDVVYVEPMKQKTGSIADQTTKIFQFAGIGLGIINLIVILTRR